MFRSKGQGFTGVFWTCLLTYSDRFVAEQEIHDLGIYGLWD